MESLGEDLGEDKKIAFYVRSSTGSKKALTSQLEKLKEKYGPADYEIKDRSSGLNEKRPGLKKLIKLAKEGEISKIYITQKDRLSRFGYIYLEELFKAYGVTIEVAFRQEDKTLQKELMDDFMSLIALFSGKFYRLRGYEEKKKLLEQANQRLEENHDSNNRASSKG